MVAESYKSFESDQLKLALLKDRSKFFHEISDMIQQAHPEIGTILSFYRRIWNLNGWHSVKICTQKYGVCQVGV